MSDYVIGILIGFLGGLAFGFLQAWLGERRWRKNLQEWAREDFTVIMALRRRLGMDDDAPFIYRDGEL